MHQGYLTPGRSQEFFYSFPFAEVPHAKSLLLCRLRRAASESGLRAFAVDSLRSGECAGRTKPAQSRCSWPRLLQGMPRCASAHDSRAGFGARWACGPSPSLRTIQGRIPSPATPFVSFCPTASGGRTRPKKRPFAGIPREVGQPLSRFAARLLTFRIFACPTGLAGPGEISSWWTAGAGELRCRAKKWGSAGKVFPPTPPGKAASVEEPSFAHGSRQPSQAAYTGTARLLPVRRQTRFAARAERGAALLLERRS